MTKSRRKLIVFSIVVIALCFLSYISIHFYLFTSENKINLTEFELYAKRVKKDWKIPGMAIAMVQNSKILYERGFGKRNTNGDPVTVDTVFDIASLTKSFTATLLAIQIDQNYYTWNMPVFNLYPNFKLYNEELTRDFKIKNLIAHNSGLPENALDSLSNFGYSADQSIYALRFVKPVSPLGEKFAYQNIFLKIAKKIIEHTADMTYRDYLYARIFNPLGMTHSYLRTDKALKENSNVAQPFLITKDLKNHPYSLTSPYLSQSWALSPGIASGGIQSSANDMALWLLFNMNNGTFKGKRLVSQTNMQFIHSPQTIIKRSKTGKIEQAYGEGWFIDKTSYFPNTLLYHSGGGTGMHAMMAYIPEKKLGMVVLTNQYTNKVPEILIKRFFDMSLNKRPLKDWNIVYLKKRQKEIVQLNLISALNHCQQNSKVNLDNYVGVYHNDIYGKLIIKKIDQKLYLFIGPAKIKWRLMACQKTKFKAYWPNPNGMNVPMLNANQDSVLFKVGQDGKPVQMTIPFLNENGYGVFMKQHLMMLKNAK